MRLRVLGLVLNAIGVAGLAVAALATGDHSPFMFTVEASIALIAGMTCVAIDGLRDSYRGGSLRERSSDTARPRGEPS